MASTDTPDERLLNPDIAAIALGTLKSNSKLNFAARVLLMLFALTASVLGEQLLALTAPVLLLVALAGLAAITAFVAYSRGLEESIRTMVEEQLSPAKRGHGGLLWIGRTLFIVTLGLFSAAVIGTIWHGADPWTITLGATSMAGAIFAVAKNVPETIARDVANVEPVQRILTGAHRQISMLESHAFASLNTKDMSRADAHVALLAVRDRMDSVVDKAVTQIEKFTDRQPVAQVIQFRRPKAA